MASVVGVNHAPTTEFTTTEASTGAPPISAPVSSSIFAAMPRQLGSTPGPETPHTVGHLAAITIIANY